jgi:hypothetical protein
VSTVVVGSANQQQAGLSVRDFGITAVLCSSRLAVREEFCDKEFTGCAHVLGSDCNVSAEPRDTVQMMEEHNLKDVGKAWSTTTSNSENE